MIGDGGNDADDGEGLRLNAGDTLILPIASTDNVEISGPDTSQTFNIAIVK